MKATKTKQDIINLLNKLPAVVQISFAIHCCNDIKDLIADPRSLKALELTEKWLKDPKSVSSQELYAAVHVAYVAHVVHVAHVAYAAAHVAYAAYAANVAVHAAVNASHATDNYDVKIDQYYYDLVEMCKNLTELERVLLNIDIAV